MQKFSIRLRYRNINLQRYRKMSSSSRGLLFQSKPYSIDKTKFAFLFTPIIDREPKQFPYLLYKALPYLYICIALLLITDNLDSYLKPISIICCLISGFSTIYARNLQKRIYKYEKKVEDIQSKRQINY